MTRRDRPDEATRGELRVLLTATANAPPTASPRGTKACVLACMSRTAKDASRFSLREAVPLHLSARSATCRLPPRDEVADTKHATVT